MYKQLMNEMIINLTISVVGPLLIRGKGEQGVDPTRPEIQFIRAGGVVYLPGTSLKGLIRSHAEQIVRTVGGQVWSCNPLGTRSVLKDDNESQYSCNEYFKSKGDLVGSSMQKYVDSCTICRIFGNQMLTSRLQVADAYPSTEIIAEDRHSIAIDRIYGSPIPSTLTHYEVVTAGSFETTIRLKNYTLAQVGLISLVLRDMIQERLVMGSGRSRGLGRIHGKITDVDIRYPVCTLKESVELLNGRTIGDANQLFGVGALSDEKDYHFPNNDQIALPEDLAYTNDDWAGVELKTTEDAKIIEIWKGCVSRWREEVGNHAN